MSRERRSDHRRMAAGWTAVGASAFLLAITLVPGYAGANSAANRFVYHLGDSFLAAVDPSFAPDNATASANGDYVLLAGNGTYNAGAKRVDGGGWFEHHHSNGSLEASGTWTAVSVKSYHGWGNGVAQGLPHNLFGGRLVLNIVVTPTGTTLMIPAVMVITCELGHPPAGAVEGFTLSVTNLINFDTSSGGATVFVLTKG